MECPLLEIVSERFVNPFTSTPPSLRSYKLSYNDQIAVKSYVTLAFFYPNPNLNQASNSLCIRSTTESETSHVLENALSKTLSYYYPFAGRLRDNLFVECNDMGVNFIVARIKCSMTELQKHPRPQLINIVFNKSLFFSLSTGNDSLVLVQLSYFDCGGMAVSICMSHKLGDASTLSSFMRDWAAMVRKSSHIPSPQFVGASLFPPLDDPSSIKEFPISASGVPIRKFVFDAPKITLLKDMLAKWGVKNPTRVEVVSALLYRCAMVSYRAVSRSFRPAMLVHALNLRPVAALPKDSVGNMVTQFAIETIEEDEMTLLELVSRLRNAKVKIQNEYKEKEKANGCPSQLPVKEDLMVQATSKKTSMDLYSCSSWCRIPFYEVDFGRGRPSTLSLINASASLNHFVLMDTRNEDSIEAMTMLKDGDHMSAFETNEELLAYASLVA